MPNTFMIWPLLDPPSTREARNKSLERAFKTRREWLMSYAGGRIFPVEGAVRMALHTTDGQEARTTLQFAESRFLLITTTEIGMHLKIHPFLQELAVDVTFATAEQLLPRKVQLQCRSNEEE